MRALFVIGIYLLMSACAVAMYAVDKRRAASGAWRISEVTLHAIELLGGWPGALAAQRVFRHKRRKTSYMAVFWTIVAAHAVGWAWWLGAFG
jgi:uncharacterized membrane protein YsdA (DUF1294 family)